MWRTNGQIQSFLSADSSLKSDIHFYVISHVPTNACEYKKGPVQHKKGDMYKIFGCGFPMQVHEFRPFLFLYPQIYSD